MLSVRYYCHYSAQTGFGRAARDYLAALYGVDGVELEIAVLGDGIESPEPRYRFLDDLAVPFQLVEGSPDVEIYHSTPRILAEAHQLRDLEEQSNRSLTGSRGAKRIALTTWETSALPAKYARTLLGFDAVVVPSDFCAEIFDAAFHKHATTWSRGHDIDREAMHAVRLTNVIPHCFDEGLWPCAPKLEDQSTWNGWKDRPCRFYSIGAWGERKNMLGVLRAYLHEFDKRDRVQLMMVIADADFEEIRSVITRSGLPESELPELYVPADKLTEEQLIDLHATADCFVSATRGEGFGLGLFEAAISGRQIVTPMWGGQSDFLDEYTGCQAVPYQLTPCFGAERARGDGTVTVAIAPGVDCRQTWADPDLVTLGAAMRRVYEEQAESAIPEDRAVLESRFGYKTIGPMFANLLREIAFS